MHGGNETASLQPNRLAASDQGTNGKLLPPKKYYVKSNVASRGIKWPPQIETPGCLARWLRSKLRRAKQPCFAVEIGNSEAESDPRLVWFYAES